MRLLRDLRKGLNKKAGGFVSMDLVLSPWTILFEIVFLLVFVMIIYYGIVYTFFQLIIMTGAREASINSDTVYIQQKIYDVVTHTLPPQEAGFTLFQPSDIVVDSSDGAYVTVKATYHVMLPGGDLLTKLGGSRASMIVSAPAKFSFLREYN